MVLMWVCPCVTLSLFKNSWKNSSTINIENNKMKTVSVDISVLGANFSLGH